MSKIAHQEIGDDDLVTLAEACQLFLGGRLTPSALRTEAAKGNLDIIQIARKDFTTRRAVEEMKRRCLRSASRPDCGYEERPAEPHGSSSTESAISAQDALRMRLKRLSSDSQNTSQKSTKPRAEVVRLR